MFRRKIPLALRPAREGELLSRDVCLFHCGCKTRRPRGMQEAAAIYGNRPPAAPSPTHCGMAYLQGVSHNPSKMGRRTAAAPAGGSRSLSILPPQPSRCWLGWPWPFQARTGDDTPETTNGADTRDMRDSDPIAVAKLATACNLMRAIIGGISKRTLPLLQTERECCAHLRFRPRREERS